MIITSYHTGTYLAYEEGITSSAFLNKTQHIQVNYHRSVTETPFDWCFAGVQIVAQNCVLSELYFKVSNGPSTFQYCLSKDH